MSPLLTALIEVDNNARLLMRASGNTRQKEQLRDAVQDLRAKVLDVLAQRAADSEELDVDTFKAIVRLAAKRGKWTDFVTAFNQVGREVGGS